MKKERYFRDELRRLFIGYAIIPAVIFTLVCGGVSMAALVYGKKSGNQEYNTYVSTEFLRVLEGYENELDRLAGEQELFKEKPGLEQRAEIFEDFYEASNRLGYEADIFALDKDGKLLLSNRSDLPEYLRMDEKGSWGIFEAMESRPGETAVRLIDGWKSGTKEIAIGRTLIQDGGTAGYLVFTVSSRLFQPILKRSDTQIIIADKFGWLYLSNGSEFLDSSNQVIEELKTAGKYLPYKRHMYLVSKQPVYHDMFQVYAISDIQNIVTSLGISSALIITALILMTVWVLISSRKVTEKKTDDFYRILDVLEEARNGNLNTAIQIQSDNEFRIIADAYNETISSLRNQMENNKKMAELVAAAQNKQLESQFNPHFLYNTLENIRYMCKIEPEVAEKMVFSLSGLLRYSLDGSKTEVTLEEDLEHLENYLTILKYRFNRRFSYQIEIEEEARTCRIPKLVLQPMIENSVKYGFGKQANLKVELKAYLHEGKLIMICRDDGVGITPGVLSEITELLSMRENRSRHSGLYNINRRIEILYGRPYGVEIRSAEGYGTTLIVTLPAHRGDEAC